MLNKQSHRLEIKGSMGIPYFQQFHIPFNLNWLHIVLAYKCIFNYIYDLVAFSNTVKPICDEVKGTFSFSLNQQSIGVIRANIVFIINRPYFYFDLSEKTIYQSLKVDRQYVKKKLQDFLHKTKYFTYLIKQHIFFNL